jgi:hypothetical protein
VRKCGQTRAPLRTEMCIFAEPAPNLYSVLTLFLSLFPIPYRGRVRMMGGATPPDSDPWDVERLRLASVPDLQRLVRRRPPRHRRGESFLRGPIPYAWVAAACRLAGAGPNVAFVVRFLRNRFARGRDRRWSIGEMARILGVSHDSVRRGSRSAEGAGLLSIAGRRGRKLIVADIAVTRPSSHGRGEERPPLFGPIPGNWLILSVQLPEPALRVGMACWLQAGWERSARIEFVLGDWEGPGLDRFSASRGLDRLVSAGLVDLECRPGHPGLVTILRPKATLQARVAAILKGRRSGKRSSH